MLVMETIFARSMGGGWNGEVKHTARNSQTVRKIDKIYAWGTPGVSGRPVQMSMVLQTSPNCCTRVGRAAWFSPGEWVHRS